MLTKNPTPGPTSSCLRGQGAEPLPASGCGRRGSGPQAKVKTTVIDDRFRAFPTRFRIPVSGELTWEHVPGWKIKAPTAPFKLEPGQALEIPLQAEVAPGAYSKDPELTIAFNAGHFHNRTLSVSPFQFVGAHAADDPEGGCDGRSGWRRCTRRVGAGDGPLALGYSGSGGRGERCSIWPTTGGSTLPPGWTRRRRPRTSRSGWS